MTGPGAANILAVMGWEPRMYVHSSVSLSAPIYTRRAIHAATEKVAILDTETRTWFRVNRSLAQIEQYVPYDWSELPNADWWALLDAVNQWRADDDQ
jgi:hypothetical protein